ncbi:hypothetical protein Shyd_82990 [Streptomyces hydrogenans]|uniref:HTH marR-type domain-containing protein n=1 Tax=Streptomyces hydrogenans TaxID=1873719 RepID=A0ABQ3PPI1_9ACTN|nr:hypothetical protein Shyd_82990 [Streptomyces hydrogenans]
MAGAAVTVARLLGCSASAGERVLERLEDRELVLRVRAADGVEDGAPDAVDGAGGRRRARPHGRR